MHSKTYFLHIKKCAGTSFIRWMLAKPSVRPFVPNVAGMPVKDDCYPEFCGKGPKFWLDYWNMPVKEQLSLIDGHYPVAPRFESLNQEDRSNPKKVARYEHLEKWYRTKFGPESKYGKLGYQVNFVANEGHLGIDWVKLPGFTYITILRDPLDRVFSAINHYMRISKLPFEKVIERFLSGDGPGQIPTSNVITYYLSGQSVNGLDMPAVQEALRRLEDFDVVIEQGDIVNEIQQMEKRLGWPHEEFLWLNRKNSGQLERDYVEDSFPELFEKLKIINASDLELWRRWKGTS